jgi:hypothetical protein
MGGAYSTHGKEKCAEFLSKNIKGRETGETRCRLDLKL